VTLTAEQMEARARGLGGSDAGAVLGLSPYRTPVDVWAEKTGRAAPDDLSDVEAVHWGNVLEDVVAREFARRTGAKIRRVTRTLQHPDLPHLLAHIDRQIVGDPRGPGVLEVKTAGQYTADRWGPSGTDEVPEEYLAQTAHYLAVTGYAFAHLAVLIGGRDFRVYNLPRDEELIDLVVRREDQFWREHVLADVPPAPVNDADLATLYATDNGQALLATPEIEAAVADLRALREHISKLTRMKADSERQVKAYMGEAAVLVDAEGKPLVTWKKAKDSEQLDAKRLRAERPDIAQQYMTTRTGSRRFLVKD